ncbi:MAG TPA: hypothetical protein VLL75_03960 [Vicinamibacteria bacterium]|nr:hypothetical protein [Vicinamibacteria bacterium]
MSFEVLDCLDSLVRLTRRSPTLDGSVPVRVARGCVPLLEGNAYGIQLTLARPLRLARRLGRWHAAWDEADGRVLERLHRGAVPRLGVEGFTPSPRWQRALARAVATPSGRGIRLFTGLLVKPDTDVWLRVTSAANRRNTLFEVVEQVVPDGAWVPLVLDLRPARGAPSPFRVEGEIGTLAPLQPGITIHETTLASTPELARAHARFYDRAYFEDKKEDVTGKYRRLVAGEARTENGATGMCSVARIGASSLEVRPLGPFTTAAGPAPVDRTGDPRRIDTLIFRNEVAFTALYDGHTLSLDYDRKRLRSKTAAVERSFLAAAPESAREHPGAALYLTKYFTPHPPGEPHFFVKPWAFTRTPPGWSSLLDGLHGDGYDVMRGVVSTDSFFATPAVFRVHREGAPVHVPEGRPLLRLLPVPRRLLAAEFRLRRL